MLSASRARVRGPVINCQEGNNDELYMWSGRLHDIVYHHDHPHFLYAVDLCQVRGGGGGGGGGASEKETW